jgi:hypothetical protein
MPGSWVEGDFPALSEHNSYVTSHATKHYNCIAWAAGEDFRRWWPDPMGVGFWPASAPREVTMQAFLVAFATLGFEPCGDGAFEAGVEKIVLMGRGDATGWIVPTHAARQLESGAWTSKLGSLEDIRHETVDVIEGPLYGEAVEYMSRPRP